MAGLTTQLKNLPDAPGIYLFYNSRGDLVYVGKATSLRSRVRSYFAGKKSPRPIEEMIHEVVKIKWVATDSVLEAVILEGEYIKKFRPKYNIRWRDDKSWNYLVFTKDTYPKFLTMRAHELDKMNQKEFKYVFGPYPHLNTKATLNILRRIFKYSNCKPGHGKPCFYRQIGQCLGVCTGEITPKEYRAKVISPLALFLRGGKKRLIKNLEKEMKMVSRKEDFEEAGRLRDQLRLLKHIHDIALLNESFVHDQTSGAKKEIRIEGYDISNLGPTGKVGSLVVFDESGPRKNEYKKFNIKGVVGQSDVDCLAEVLKRRFNHPEWPYPDVVLVDGGKPQVNTALKIFLHHPLAPSSIRRGIQVVGIAKGPDRKKNEIILGTKTPAFASWVYKHLKFLIQVRDEAHRFAIAFQRSKRKF